MGVTQKDRHFTTTLNTSGKKSRKQRWGGGGGGGGHPLHPMRFILYAKLHLIDTIYVQYPGKVVPLEQSAVRPFVAIKCYQNISHTLLPFSHKANLSNEVIIPASRNPKDIFIFSLH